MSNLPRSATDRDHSYRINTALNDELMNGRRSQVPSLAWRRITDAAGIRVSTETSALRSSG